MNREAIAEYIKCLLSQLDEIVGDVIDKDTAEIMLLSIIGKIYSG